MSSKQRPGFDHSILGETGAGQGYTGSRAPPLVVVEARAEPYSAVLRWGKVWEVNARQDEHHRLQHLLMSSAGTDNRDQRGTRGRARKQGGGGRCQVEYRLNAFLGCVLFWFGGGGAVMFGRREGAGHGVLWSLWLQCFGFSWNTKTRQRSEGEYRKHWDDDTWREIKVHDITCWTCSIQDWILILCVNMKLCPKERVSLAIASYLWAASIFPSNFRWDSE